MSPAHLRGHALGVVVCSLILASCSGQQTTRGPGTVEPQDGPSMTSIRAEDIKDAEPRNEPRAPYGNRSPYEVLGKKYYLLDSSAGYQQRGIASWYGTKFHGRRTSSGEPYDMHLATAAHKTLPLPTYAEVTNLDNGRRVIVKINDRGPFKNDRLIDLSYGAALRLDMIPTGTARVEVRAIDTSSMQVAATRIEPGTYLQVGAYSDRNGAESVADRLGEANLSPVTIDDSSRLYRVWLGPYATNVDIDRAIQRTIELGFERPHKVVR